MQKRLYFPILVLILAIALSSCSFKIITGSGNVVTETRQVGSFSAITLAGIGDVYVTQADTVSLRIEAEDNLIPYFETTVKGDTLTIGIKDESLGVNLQPTKPVKFFVSTPDVKTLSIAGSGNIITTDLVSTDFKAALSGSGSLTNATLKADSLDISLGGSGDITFGKVTAVSVKSTINGSGNITLSGDVTSQETSIVGSGDYQAHDLQSGKAVLKVTGSGQSQVWATDTLSVSITGSGDVTYRGNPTLNSNITGSGHLNSSN